MSSISLAASKVGSLWIPFLIREEVPVGEVVNVFRRTINIRCMNGMLLSITASNYSSPIYVNVTSGTGQINFQKHVRPYEEVFFKRSDILVGDLRINVSLSKEKFHFPRTCSMCILVNSFANSYGFLLRLYKKILYFINIVDKQNNILELIAKMKLEKKIRSILEQIKGYVVHDDNSEVLAEVYNILGLGYGVTPSTDDFIGGLLGTLNIYLACNKMNPLILNIERVLSKTNWVSGYLLYYNHFGLFNSILEDFIENVFRRELEKSIDSFLSLISIGHTSGLDMSLGALAAFAIVEEVSTGVKIIDDYFNLFFRNFIVKYRK